MPSVLQPHRRDELCRHTSQATLDSTSVTGEEKYVNQTSVYLYAYVDLDSSCAHYRLATRLWFDAIKGLPLVFHCPARSRYAAAHATADRVEIRDMMYFTYSYRWRFDTSKRSVAGPFGSRLFSRGRLSIGIGSRTSVGYADKRWLGGSSSMHV